MLNVGLFLNSKTMGTPCLTVSRSHRYVELSDRAMGEFGSLSALHGEILSGSRVTLN